MVEDGSQEVKGQINLRIQLMESHGQHPLLVMRYLQTIVKGSHGMAHDGSLVEMK